MDFLCFSSGTKPAIPSAVARWYGSVRLEDPETGPGDSGRLIGEVSHAAGNLVHRMYYWTGVLEEQPEPTDSDEAVRELRDTLGGLHQLVKRTMDLLRPVKLHLINVAAAELFRSVAIRLGVDLGDAEIAPNQGLVRAELRVYPFQIARSFG